MHHDVPAAAAPWIGAEFEREASLGTHDAGGVALESKAAERDGLVEELQSFIRARAPAVVDGARLHGLVIEPKPEQSGER